MTLWAIVPVKPLRRGKSRLADVLSLNERTDLNRHLLENTLDTLKDIPEIEHVLVVSRDSEALAMARETGERHLEAALENNLADTLEAAGRRDEAMEHLKLAAAAFADIAAVSDEPEPGIWMLESW